MMKIKFGLLGVLLLMATVACDAPNALSLFSLGVMNPTITLFVRNLTPAPIPLQAVTRYADLPQSTSPEGYPQIGDPQAPSQLLAYMSFDCNHCTDFHNTTFAKLLQFIRSGDVLFTYVPLYGTGALPNGRDADIAALCAGKQGQFWAYQDAVYSWTETYGTEAFIAKRLRAGAKNLGLDLDQWDSCVASPAMGLIVDNANDEAFRKGHVPGTPAIAVNGSLLPSNDLDTITRALGVTLPNV